MRTHFCFCTGGGQAFAALLILAAMLIAILTRPQKWLSDFDQSFYLSIAYDISPYACSAMAPSTSRRAAPSATRHVLRPGVSMDHRVAEQSGTPAAVLVAFAFEPVHVLHTPR